MRAGWVFFQFFLGSDLGMFDGVRFLIVFVSLGQ
jgi:hypothetical protein